MLQQWHRLLLSASATLTVGNVAAAIASTKLARLTATAPIEMSALAASVTLLLGRTLGVGNVRERVEISSIRE
jgi:hypothetical protein